MVAGPQSRYLGRAGSRWPCSLLVISVSLLAAATVGATRAQEDGDASPTPVVATDGDGGDNRVTGTQASRPQLSPSLCLTKQCVLAASRILQKMDSNTDPCDNFYRFACGGFLDSTVIPDDRSSQNIFSLTRDELEQRMRRLVDAPESTEDAPATALMKRVFTSCTDKDGIEKRGLQPLRDILDEMGGWPVLQGASWNGTGFSWRRQIRLHRRLGYSTSYLISAGVFPDLRNSTRRNFELDDPELGMGRKYLIKGFNDSDVQGYYRYMVDMAELLGADRELAKQDMKLALLFEIELANMSRAAEEKRNLSIQDNPTSLHELQSQVPDIHWVEYLNSLLEPAGVKVDEEEIINLPHLAYLKNFTELMKRTPARVQANYLLWRVVQASVDELNAAARDVRLRFYADVYGIQEHQPRWKECLSNVLSSYTIAAGSLYVRTHFGKEEQVAALEMVTDIHRQFDHLLQNLAWMDDHTREKAMEKSSTIAYHIGYPDELLNTTLVADFYSELKTSADDYFGNVRRKSVFTTNYSYGKLREPVDKLDWRTHSKMAMVNAFYRASDNSITFPAGILQGDFYEAGRPRYLNYGAIGTIIGHEISHGFDDKGRQFDGQGELTDWWRPETSREFVTRARCMIEQYSNITVPEAGLNLNGITTQGENIADTGGLKVARLAYDRYTAAHGRESALPGLQQYSNEQMFWVGFSNAWCNLQRPESLKKQILTNSHAPAFARVNRVLQNLNSFARDWQCPPGSPMNPVDRCAVW